MTSSDNQIDLLGYKLISNKAYLSSIILKSLRKKKNIIINTINVHSYVVQKKDSDFKDALQKSNYLIPDGSGMVFAANILKRKNIKRITGYDLFLEIIAKINEFDVKNKKVMFLGATDATLKQIKERLIKEYPNIKFSSLSPPFKSKFSNSDIKNFIESINNESPNVVFVGLTAPKQEILINAICQDIKVDIISGIGAVFDFYSGTIKRPHNFFIKLNIEFIGRFIQNPIKMYKRVFISIPIFIIEVFVLKIKNIIRS